MNVSKITNTSYQEALRNNGHNTNVDYDADNDFLVTFNKTKHVYLVDRNGKVYPIQSTYNITYVLNGGINHNSNPSKYKGDNVKLYTPLYPNSDGDYYIFDGWYTDEEFKTNKIESLNGITQNITLYAKWKNAPVIHAFLYDNGVLEFNMLESGTLNGIITNSYEYDPKTVIPPITYTGTNTVVFSGNPWYQERMNVTKVVITEKITPYSTASWFENFENLKEIENINNIDMSNVINMQSMFRHCYNLENLNLSSFDTSNVITMVSVFSGCKNLKTLNVEHFNTSNVLDMYAMFFNCSSLTSLDVSSFDTSNVTRTREMFQLCENLTSLDLKNFDTNKTTDMSYMFKNDNKLNNIYVTYNKWKTASTNYQMFYDCGTQGLVYLKIKEYTDLFASYNIEENVYDIENNNILKDLTTNGNDITLTNIALTEDKKAIILNGNNSYGKIALQQPLTFPIILEMDISCTKTSRQVLFIEPLSQIAFGINAEGQTFNLTTGGKKSNKVNIPPDFFDGNIKHVVIEWIDLMTFNLYVNDIPMPLSTNTDYWSNDDSNNVYLGTRYSSNNYNSYFNGKIYNFRIYKGK